MQVLSVVVSLCVCRSCTGVYQMIPGCLEL